jgi:tetrahydromethanopterin S-methyltransferase subunit B
VAIRICLSCAVRGVGLGFYAFYACVALVATFTALATWAMSRGRISIHFNRSRPEDDQSLRAEIARTLETARTAMRIGEAVIAAMRPIQAALRDLSSRIAAMEHRADESYRLHVGHPSIDNRLQSPFENTTRAVDEMDIQLTHVRLIAITDRLCSIDQSIEGLTLQIAEGNRAITEVEHRVGAIDERIAQLSSRVDTVERSLASGLPPRSGPAWTVLSGLRKTQRRDMTPTNGHRAPSPRA